VQNLFSQAPKYMVVVDPQLQYDKALAFLLSRIDYERSLAIPYNSRDFRLDRMRQLLGRLGNPQKRLRIVHVAGTKGKGSTSAMISAVLSAAGYRTGLYTSPHLNRIEERIRLNGQICTEADFVALVEQIRPIAQTMDDEASCQSPPEQGPTYFELTTAMAFQYFAQVQTDFAVIEVGLGGRLDSTNVCEPMVCAITSISLDHTQQLGNTLAQIASEKAGIIKPGVPIVSGVQQDEPRVVIAEIARQQESLLLQLGADFNYTYYPPSGLEHSVLHPHGRMDFQSHIRGSAKSIERLELGLLGEHQAANAAVALAVLGELKKQGFDLPESAIRDGLASLNWPARIEVAGLHPTVIVDGAHNVASVQSLLQTIEESFQSARRILIFGTTQGKDVRGILEALLPRFEAVILTRYVNNPRQVSVTELDCVAAALSSIPRFVCDNPSAAWVQARQLATADHLICITGSLFLAAEIKAEIEKMPIAMRSYEHTGQSDGSANRSAPYAPVISDRAESSIQIR
jgi:dihydrofolate synthase / folylpolyglutamate synthase